MNTVNIIISAFTAFIIAGGGALSISFLALKGAMPGNIVWVSAIVLGLVSAAKDTRSLLKLPPVNGNTPDQPTQPPTT